MPMTRDGDPSAQLHQPRDQGVYLYPVRQPRDRGAASPAPSLWGAGSRRPTCTEEGYTTHTCTVCGDQYVDCYVNSRGHSWDRGRVTAPPTETASGVRIWLCTRCGDNRTEAIGPCPTPLWM